MPDVINKLHLRWLPLDVARIWGRHWLEPLLSPNSDLEIPTFAPSYYLSLPLMSVLNIARLFHKKTYFWNMHILLYYMLIYFYTLTFYSIYMPVLIWCSNTDVCRDEKRLSERCWLVWILISWFLFLIESVDCKPLPPLMKVMFVLFAWKEHAL